MDRTSVVIILLFTTSCALFLLYDCFAGASRRLLPGIAGGFAALAACVALLVLPVVDPLKSAKGFCASLRDLNDRGIEYDLYSVGFSREEYVYYAKHFHQKVPGMLFSEDASAPADFEAAQQNLKVLRAIQKAVRSVTLAPGELRSEAGASRLREALEGSLQGDAELKAAALKLESSLGKSLDDLFQVLHSSTPALVIAQEADWRWVTALNPGATQLAVVEDRSVGSRDMLLLANPSAEALIHAR